MDRLLRICCLTGLFALFGFHLQSFAQGTIEGNIVNEDGLAIQGATVLIQGLTTGALTDERGYFQVKIRSGRHPDTEHFLYRL